MVVMKNLQSTAGCSGQGQIVPMWSRSFSQVVRDGSEGLLPAWLSTASVVIYIVSKVLFGSTTLANSYPWLATSGLPALLECVALALACIGLIVRCSKLSFAQVLICCLAVSLSSISAVNTGDYLLLQDFIIIAAIPWDNIERLLKIYGLIVLSIIIATMIFAVFGCLYNKDVIPNERLVYAFGFSHPNTLGGILFSVTSALSLAYWKSKYWWIPNVLALLSAIFSFVALSSRTAAILCVLFSVLSILLHKLPMNNMSTTRRIMRVVIIAIPVALLFLMSFCSIWYDSSNPFFAFMDRITSYRPYYSHEYYTNVGSISLFGRPIEIPPHYHNGVPFQSLDSGYSYMIFVYGLGALVALLITYLYAVPMIVKSEYCLGFSLLIVMSSIYFLIERFPLYIAMSPAILLLSYAFEPRGVVLDE